VAPPCEAQPGSRGGCPDVSATPERTDRELLRRYHHDGDVEARERLIEQYLPLVRSLARRYSYRGEQLEDLVQVGCIGLI
jgi:RNA polymerase sigma-B factor